MERKRSRRLKLKSLFRDMQINNVSILAATTCSVKLVPVHHSAWKHFSSAKFDEWLHDCSFRCCWAWRNLLQQGILKEYNLVTVLAWDFPRSVSPHVVMTR
jgi:hypothetical protein